MKPSPNEKLSDYLAQMEEDLLDRAFAVDNPEKLKKYKEEKRQRRPVFRGVIVAAACLVLILGVCLVDRRDPIYVVPNQTQPLQAGPNQTLPPQNNPTEPPVQIMPSGPIQPTPAPEGFKIRNIDMLNYYAAIQVLTSQSTLSASGETEYIVSKLSGRQEVTLPEDTEGPPLQPPTEPTEPEGGYEKYYYTFEPGMIFYVTRVMFFQIELTNPDGFLASQVGCGVVDVVITKNSIGDMITFKNGDRFYSCIVNGQGQMYMEFSTHIYVEGFAVVKNTDPESYRFTVTFDGNQITGQPQVIGMEIGPFEAGSHPDGVARVIGETYTKEMFAAFNIELLEEFFKNGILPEGLL